MIVLGKDNDYEIFRNVKTLDKYFSTWDPINVSVLTKDLKEKIYSRYILKCFVFQRDRFACKNEHCRKNGSPLTLHHIKFQKNGGKDSPKNCVTICKSCHQSFNKGSISLTFDGATYRMSKSSAVNWKVVKKTNRQLRKKLKLELESIHISQELFERLMRFLLIDMSEDMDDD